MTAPIPIRILICEDSDDDATLIAAHLRRGGLSVGYERAESAAQVADALRLRPPDLVISDYNIPGFGAEQALELLDASGLDIPFILVSGRIGEESAVSLMRAGAHDFVLKDRMAKLVQVIRRELGQAADRRERRDAEAALRVSEQRFRLFADHSPDVMFRYRVHPVAEVEYFSPAARAVLGRRPEDLCGDPAGVFALVAPEDREALEAEWHSPSPQPLVVRWCRPDGGEAWTEQRAVALHDETGRVVAVEGILRDITDRVRADIQRDRLQQQLRQAERLESLGRLAGGIAHDFNNLLAVILGRTDLALADLAEESPHRAGMELIRTLAERGAALTRQLLVFSRQEPLRPETLDVDEVVADTERVLRGAIGEDVEFVTRLAANRQPVLIDRSELERLLLNLVANSRRAMPYGGRLTIETSTLALHDGDRDEDGDALDPDGDPVGRREDGDRGADGEDEGHPGIRRVVRVRVTDTGVGMSEKVRKNAFEPFYTTDSVVGTGLGLSSAYGVVKSAGGDIRLSSRPGAGTTVSIDLPAVARTAGQAASAEPAPPDGQGQTLLVVEDDDAVRDLVSLMVRRNGYRAVAVASPADALEVFAQQDRRIDALLTDMVMAGMSGIELAETVRARLPGLPVLLMSGYAAAALPGRAEIPEGMSMIRKPFTTVSLMHALGAVLGRAG